MESGVTDRGRAGEPGGRRSGARAQTILVTVDRVNAAESDQRPAHRSAVTAP